MKYMVAVDGSKNATAAFYTALGLIRDKEQDELDIVTVVEDVNSYAKYTFMGDPDTSIPFATLNENVKKQASVLLRSYEKVAMESGVKCSLLLGTSNHYGDMICHAVEKKKIDVLVIGRRGMSKLKRMVMGSTSRYCVEHADCTVLVVKGEWGPDEEHINKDLVKKLEEEERQRRIDAEQLPSTQQHIEREKKLAKEITELVHLP